MASQYYISSFKFIGYSVFFNFLILYFFSTDTIIYFYFDDISECFECISKYHIEILL